MPNDGECRGTKRARGAEAGGGETSGPLSDFISWQQQKTECSHMRQKIVQRVQEQAQTCLNEIRKKSGQQPTTDAGLQEDMRQALEIKMTQTELEAVKILEKIHTEMGSKILPQALVQCVGEPKFWQVALDGVLTLSSSSPNNHKNVPTAGGSQNSITRRLVEDGFACVSRCDKSGESELVAKLHAGAKQLHAMGLPPTFTTCYDAAWQLMQLHHDRTMKPNVPATHRRVGDVLCWCIPRGGAGFAPHSSTLR